GPQRGGRTVAVNPGDQVVVRGCRYGAGIAGLVRQVGAAPARAKKGRGLARVSDTIVAKRRLGMLRAGLALFGVVLAARLFYLQVLSHSAYTAQAQQEHTRKYQVPARRGEIYLRDGDTASPAALNQTLKLMYADPRLVTDKAKTAEALAKVTGGSSVD